MLKHARTVIAALSLLICSILAACRVRSHYYGDSLYYVTSRERAVQVMSQPGCMLWTYSWTTREPVEEPGFRWQEFEWGSILETPPESPVTYGPVEPHWPQWVHHGFGIEHGEQTIYPSRIQNYDGKDLTPYQFYYESIAVPYWLVVLLAALLPGRRAYVFVRARRRKRAGLCPDCGYDLRAGHGKCPECGSPILRLLLKLLGRLRPSPARSQPVPAVCGLALGNSRR